MALRRRPEEGPICQSWTCSGAVSGLECTTPKPSAAPEVSSILLDLKTRARGARETQRFECAGIVVIPFAQVALRFRCCCDADATMQADGRVQAAERSAGRQERRRLQPRFNAPPAPEIRRRPTHRWRRATSREPY
jgi:hypothetical protein